MIGRLFDPDPEEGDNSGPDLVELEHLLPLLNDDTPTRTRNLMLRVAALSLTQPTVPPQCTWKGCDQPGVEWHHELERETFGRLAEFGPVNPYCHEHHELITLMRAEIRRREREDHDL
jgi:hypothetical protein